MKNMLYWELAARSGIVLKLRVHHQISSKSEHNNQNMHDDLTIPGYLSGRPRAYIVDMTYNEKFTSSWLVSSSCRKFPPCGRNTRSVSSPAIDAKVHPCKN